MKPQLARLLTQAPRGSNPRSLVQEYLQARILGLLQRAGAMTALAFHGGTALRFLYSLPRYSEDLDFALERPRALPPAGAAARAGPAEEPGAAAKAGAHEGAGTDRPDQDVPQRLQRYVDEVQSGFDAEGYCLTARIDTRGALHRTSFRFQGLLRELALSRHPEEVLTVRMEIDTRPPAGAGVETTIVRHVLPLHLQHHDRPSLLAGKLNALLTRPFLKGRDVYDLVWYLSDATWPPPNLEMLNNALAQFSWSGPDLRPHNWRGVLWDRLEGASWTDVTRDVEPLLEHREELGLVERETVRRLLVESSA